MGVKYTLPFKAYDDVAWRIDISFPDYVGTQIVLRGVGRQCAVLAYDPDTTDDPFSYLIKSTLSINLYNEGTVDVGELQQAADREVTVTLYQNNALYWIGYLNPSGLQNSLTSAPYSLQLTASDGLSFLQDMPYQHNNLPGTTGTPNRCPMNYIRQILFSNLGLYLPIRWTNDLQCSAFVGEDMFTGGVRWAQHGEGFSPYQVNGQYKTCGYILQGILQSTQSRIYQAGGKWIIRRVPNTVGGYFNYKEIAATLGIMSVQSGVENIVNLIGRAGYRFINKNQKILVKPGLKSCKVTYSATVRDNILPNGNQDLVALGVIPLYWGSYDPELVIESVGSLDGRNGYATSISVGGRYTLVSPGGSLYANGLPIDTYTLIKKISFGFTFYPELGFPVDVNNFILWDDTFYIQLIYNCGAYRYYLTEFGFWTLTPTRVRIVVEGMKLGDIATVNFDKFQGIIMPLPIAPVQEGDTSDLQVVFEVTTGQKYTLDNIYVSIDEANDVYESTLDSSKNTLVDEREITISSSFGGYMLSNYMSEWYNSDIECFYKDALIYEGTLTGLAANAIMRYRYKPSDIYNGDMSVRGANWNFDQIYMLDSMLAKKFLPLNANYNIEKCECSLVAIECRNDNITFTEKHYSSNDQPLSN